ncbi:MAG: CHRD domain-containing protein [Planctomycetes bacterium]|nr:CHRD domain-containing protein [Planctomycetota bacterium]
MSGAQEVPPVVTAGTGFCTVTLDDVTGAVSVSGSFSGLTSTATAAHIHGPAPAGAIAGILVTLTETGGTSGNVSGSGTLSPANITNLLNGLTYINVHTTINGGGEIRGQITQEVPALPWQWMAVLAVVAMAGGAFVLTRRSPLAAA